MKTWPEVPDRADVEAVVRDYFGLLRVGQVDDAAKLVDHTPVPHVLRSLWKGSVGTTLDEELGDGLPVDAWSTDRSWLGELALGDFSWGGQQPLLRRDHLPRSGERSVAGLLGQARR